MRVAAISDIHGNLPALEAVLAEVEGEDVGEIVVVVDTISRLWPVEVFDVVDARGAKVAHGNADREVLERSDRYRPVSEKVILDPIDPPAAADTAAYFESLRGA